MIEKPQLQSTPPGFTPAVFVGTMDLSWRIPMTFDRSTHDPLKMGGKPCIRGLRVTVPMILGLISANRSHDEILAAYPYLEAADIEQAVAFAEGNEKTFDLP